MTTRNETDDRQETQRHGGDHRPIGRQIETLRRDAAVRRAATLTALGADDLNARQETFAQGMAKGASGVEAARQAGYTGAPATLAATASRLLRKSKVKVRIDALKAEGQEVVRLTRDGHRRQLREVAALALRQGNLHVLLKARELEGKMEGFYVEKVQTEDVTEKARKLPLDEQVALMFEAQRRLFELRPELRARLLSMMSGKTIDVEQSESA